MLVGPACQSSADLPPNLKKENLIFLLSLSLWQEQKENGRGGAVNQFCSPSDPGRQVSREEEVEKDEEKNALQQQQQQHRQRQQQQQQQQQQNHHHHHHHYQNQITVREKKENCSPLADWNFSTLSSSSWTQPPNFSHPFSGKLVYFCAFFPHPTSLSLAVRSFTLDAECF